MTARMDRLQHRLSSCSSLPLLLISSTDNVWNIIFMKFSVETVYENMKLKESRNAENFFPCLYPIERYKICPVMFNNILVGCRLKLIMLGTFMLLKHRRKVWKNIRNNNNIWNSNFNF